LSPTRICLDGFNLALPAGTGIATYARNLGAAIHRLGHETQVLYGPAGALTGNTLLNEIALYDAATPRRRRIARKVVAAATSWLGRTAVQLPASGEVVSAPDNGLAADVVWAADDVFNAANRGFSFHRQFSPIDFREAAGARRPDVFHWTCVLPMRARRARNLYTIHDVVPLRLPYATLDNKRAFFDACRQICRTADRVVTVSETSRADIMRIFGVGPERVVNTYQAVDVPQALRAKPAEQVAGEIEGVFGVGWGDYFLFFGAIEPKKNLSRVLEAYLAANIKTPLIVVGAEGWLSESQLELLQEGGGAERRDRVRRYEYLPYPTLVSLIRGAKATLFPSLYEGFGLPVLESMQLGAPVLASTGGSLPEVAGDAALLVEPTDVDAMKRAILTLDADADLRADLKARGLAQAARFSPQAYDARLAELYGSLA
jgi:glycosyltransferase involved in cell wall biosynthesis